MAIIEAIHDEQITPTFERIHQIQDDRTEEEVGQCLRLWPRPAQRSRP